MINNKLRETRYGIRLSRRTLLAASAASSSLLLPGRRLLAQEPLKVGFVYVGPIGDYGWTHGHERRPQGRESSISATRWRPPMSRTSPRARTPSG